MINAIYLFSGFESQNYMTHTFFYADSLPEARRLCGELYDKLMDPNPIVEELVKKQELFNEEYEVKRKAANREWERICETTDWTTIKFSAVKDKHPKRMNIVRRVLSDKEKEILQEEEMRDVYLEAVGGAAKGISKEEIVEEWMISLTEITLNTIEIMSNVDGD